MMVQPDWTPHPSENYRILPSLSTTPYFVVDFSCLNCFVKPFRFKMLMVSQVCLALHLRFWFVVLNHWHIPIFHRSHCFQAVQLGRTVLQFMVLSFHLNISLCVFTKMTKSMAQSLSQLGVKAFMYLNDWLIQVLDPHHSEVHRNLALDQSRLMGFLLNLIKS